MKILLCHNYYQQPGGEDRSFELEANLLESHGHDVIRYVRHNDEIDQMSRIAVAVNTFHNRSVVREIRALIQRKRPDVMHCTNTFPLISPAACRVAKAEGVPVVLSLRNYRLFCPNNYFLRDGSVCEDCLGKRFAWPGIQHACYRGSQTATAVVAGMVAAHWMLGTWSRAVDLYFTLTRFSRDKFIEGGLPAERIVVKPNFIDPDPGVGEGGGGYAIFVGRLSAEKGIETLLTAWRKLGTQLPLKIIGDGPLADRVAEETKTNPAIEWLGRRSPADVLSLVGEASCLIMPSLWYETFGRTIIEAFAKGTPAIVSQLGAMQELVDDGRTGLHFHPGDPVDLAQAVRRFLSRPEAWPAMRQAARGEYLAKFTAEPNHDMLMDIYRRAMGGPMHASNGNVESVRPVAPADVLETNRKTQPLQHQGPPS